MDRTAAVPGSEDETAVATHFFRVVLHGKWDSGRIGQALSNLCGNAFQHGTENAPIDVGLRGEPHQVVLTVHNKGHRIPKTHRHDIFDPFKQLEPGSTKAKDSRSVGLGLFIVQAIVTAHEGTIEVESNERGTTFTMRLPRSVPTGTKHSDSRTADRAARGA